MTDEVETQEPSTQQAPSTEAPASTEQSLEQVFESFNVDTEPAQTQQYVPQQPAPPSQPERPAEIHIPDPALDPDGFKRYEAARAADSQGLRQQLQSVVGALSHMQQAEVRRREEADIQKAVAYLHEKAPDVDPDMIEVYLGHKARKEERLLKVWNNRQKNPRAWDAALKAIGNEMVGKFAVKSDPQLAENQRAMKVAQQSMATASKEPSLDEKLGKLTGAAFDRAMDRIRNGMDPGIS
jgi:ribonuclease HI